MLFEDTQTRSQVIDHLRRAKALLHAPEVSAAEIDEHSKLLLDLREFGYARRLLARVRGRMVEDPKARLALAQRQALATYNDTDLPVDARLEGALRILEDRCNLRNTRNQDTLSLAGAVFKRRWRLDGHKENLERALTYYLRAYEQGPEHDLGHSGINAAFVLDLLADVERREATAAGGQSDMAAARDEESQAIREELVETLLALTEREHSQPDRWRLLGTLSEAMFGLGQYDQAGPWLRELRSLPVPAWQYQATVRQLAAVARIQMGRSLSVDEFARSMPGRVLKEFLGEHAEGVQGAYTGRVGLALSGGGFRASLFHIGVLARLAELDVLRHVEVLSCVAGGSIVGTHYYLLLKRLLETRPDRDITRHDYVELVRQLEQDFLLAARSNLRARVNLDPVVNFRLLFPGYTRTMRTGELFERYLFSRAGSTGRRLRSPAPMWMNRLAVRPVDTPPSQRFTIKHDNWRRCAKVPELVVNATTLNTGHNWQFTTEFMGEPPGSINTHVDSSYQLRRLRYAEAPDPHREVRLGYTVAASACVPGRTEPLSLAGLYPGIDVRLVEGGVHDNQGISALLEQDCQVMLVSDATGPIESSDTPGIGKLDARRRANVMLRARALQQSTEQLEGRRRSGLLRGLMVLHLRKDLPVEPRDWVGCDDPMVLDERAPGEVQDHRPTDYGIPIAVQRRLAAMRTDTDAFNDTEAMVLMLSGYRMAEHAFDQDDALKALTKGDAAAEAWDFLAWQPMLDAYPSRKRVIDVLSVSAQRHFKTWLASAALRRAGTIAGAVLLGLMLIIGLLFADVQLLNGAGAVTLLMATATGLFIGRRVAARSDLAVMAGRLLYGVWAFVSGPILGWWQICVLDRIYMHFGRRPEVDVASAAGHAAPDASAGDGRGARRVGAGASGRNGAGVGSAIGGAPGGASSTADGTSRT
jgi:predicted acylesterase/phospholipase RssA